LVLEYAHEYSQRRHRIHPAFPTQWFYGLYRALPRGPGSFAPVTSQIVFAKLSASIGAPEPHDFAVRFKRRRLQRHQRPPQPALYVRDDRETPLSRAG
jgi:hypothetical protein